MEVGAVKQAFNNEVILLKPKLNQAKIQVIHKLTRKAKTFTEKKAPDQLKEKLKRKAESAVNEVLIIKKIKPKDIAKFIVTHKGELNEYLNRPKVDEDKACARLLLHKALQDKYKFIRGRFSNVPIKDLFMSRLERRKMKKEEKEKQKNKKKGKGAKVVNSEGDWNVEDVEMTGTKGSDDAGNQREDLGNEKEDSEVENESNSELEQEDGDESDSDGSVQNEEKINDSEESDQGPDIDDEPVKVVPKVNKASMDTLKLKQIDTKTIVNKKNTENKVKEVKSPKEHKKNPEKKQKDTNKNKNINEKILKRNFKKETVTPILENKIVDSFFITSTGENYMSVVEPRQPDEVKEIHKQGNRQLRRAVMFGHVPKSKPRQGNYRQNKFDNQNGFGKEDNFKNKFNNNRMEFNDDRRSNFNARNDRFKKEEKEEKLHPSWEAKKKKSGLLPFEGKKIVFDDS